MKKTLLAAIFLLSTPAASQSPQIDLIAAPPPAVSNLSANVVGSGDVGEFFYWVIANYPSGAAVPAGPIHVRRAPNTLSATNFIRINWAGIREVSTYDVIRSRSSTFPLVNNSCTCAVATGLTTTTVSDTGAALGSYTIGSSPQQIRTSMRVNNRNYTQTRLEFAFPEGTYSTTRESGRWQAMGAGTLANRPASCEALRDVYICIGADCPAGDASYYYCTSTNTWTLGPGEYGATGQEVSTLFDWLQDPGAAIVAGANTITLSPCPLGLDGSNSFHYININDTDDSPPDEAVLITGGTCTPGASSGTVQFTATNAHAAGTYVLESATAGTQEAVWHVGLAGGGEIIIPRGTHELEATLSIGDGTATKTATGTPSTINFITLRGAGWGNTSDQTGATVLRWVADPGDEFIRVRGSIQGVRLSDFKVEGANQTVQRMLALFTSQRGAYRDLMLRDGGAGSVALDLNTTSSQNLFENIIIINQDTGSTSGIKIGEGSTAGGNSQNVFSRINIGTPSNEPDAYGLYLENADNNSFLQVNVFPNLEQAQGFTCGTPVSVNLDAHSRETGDSIRILSVSGQPAPTCNGVSLIGEYTITVTDPDNFTLDGTSESSPEAGALRVHGPGSSLHFERHGTTNFPVENSFYSVSFQGAFVTSTGDHGPNFFSDFSTADGEDNPDGNTFSTVDRFVGVFHPDYAGSSPNNRYMRLIGNWGMPTDADATDLWLRFNSQDQVLEIPGGAVAPALDAVTFTATPTFDADAGNIFKMTLTGNVTSSTLSNADAGQFLGFLICQDGAGSHTFTFPANFRGAGTIGAGANTCSSQWFLFDGTDAFAASGIQTGL